MTYALLVLLRGGFNSAFMRTATERHTQHTSVQQTGLLVIKLRCRRPHKPTSLPGAGDERETFRISKLLQYLKTLLLLIVQEGVRVVRTRYCCSSIASSNRLFVVSVSCHIVISLRTTLAIMLLPRIPPSHLRADFAPATISFCICCVFLNQPSYSFGMLPLGPPKNIFIERGAGDELLEEPSCCRLSTRCTTCCGAKLPTKLPTKPSTIGCREASTSSDTRNVQHPRVLLMLIMYVCDAPRSAVSRFEF